jgi:hypothetical protein
MSLRTVLESRDGWDLALTNLEKLIATKGPEAHVEAEKYASRYQGRRAAMVFDIVASRQRRYQSRVLPMVAKFETSEAAASLSVLAACKSSPVTGLQKGEWETIRNVAGGLLEFGAKASISNEDEICLRWAAATEDLRFVHRLDPFVGNVSGIGPALFAYARMRSGAQAIKPDIRLKNALAALGLQPPRGEIALLVVCEELAKCVDINLLVFDQLLWWLDA